MDADPEDIVDRTGPVTASGPVPIRAAITAPTITAMAGTDALPVTGAARGATAAIRRITAVSRMAAGNNRHAKSLKDPCFFLQSRPTNEDTMRAVGLSLGILALALCSGNARAQSPQAVQLGVLKCHGGVGVGFFSSSYPPFWWLADR